MNVLNMIVRRHHPKSDRCPLSHQPYLTLSLGLTRNYPHPHPVPSLWRELKKIVARKFRWAIMAEEVRESFTLASWVSSDAHLQVLIRKVSEYCGIVFSKQVLDLFTCPQGKLIRENTW